MFNKIVKTATAKEIPERANRKIRLCREHRITIFINYSQDFRRCGGRRLLLNSPRDAEVCIKWFFLLFFPFQCRISSFYRYNFP